MTKPQKKVPEMRGPPRSRLFLKIWNIYLVLQQVNQKVLAQGICLEAPPDVWSEVSEVTEWGALSGKSEHAPQKQL